MKNRFTNWNPGFYDKNNNFIPFVKAWFCNFNKIIHTNEKEVLNCPHCNN